MRTSRYPWPMIIPIKDNPRLIIIPDQWSSSTSDHPQPMKVPYQWPQPLITLDCWRGVDAPLVSPVVGDDHCIVSLELMNENPNRLCLTYSCDSLCSSTATSLSLCTVPGSTWPRRWTSFGRAWGGRSPPMCPRPADPTSGRLTRRRCERANATSLFGWARRDQSAVMIQVQSWWTQSQAATRGRSVTSHSKSHLVPSPKYYIKVCVFQVV